MRNSSRQSGFSLIELMIAVLIVAILVGIAIPTYSRYVMRANRAAARACMMDYAQFMERTYTSTLTYVLGADPLMGCSAESGMNQNYTFTVVSTQRTYTVTATPIGAQNTRDVQCRVLTLNQQGQRTESGTGTIADCW